VPIMGGRARVSKDTERARRGCGGAGASRVVPDERALRAARGAQRGGAVGGLGRRMVARQSEVRAQALSESTYAPSDRGEPYAPYSMLLRYMCTACAWEASGADSGKFREISAPAAPLANFSLNFAKLWDTPIHWVVVTGRHRIPQRYFKQKKDPQEVCGVVL
jgi:hypothetical protein